MSFLPVNHRYESSVFDLSFTSTFTSATNSHNRKLFGIINHFAAAYARVSPCKTLECFFTTVQKKINSKAKFLH